MSTSPRRIQPPAALERLVRRVDALASGATRDQAGTAITSIPGVVVLAHRIPTSAQGTVYKPVACLILRGRKQTIFAGTTTSVRAGELLLVTHDVVITARVIEAPYLALVFEIDLGTLRSLYDEVGAGLMGASEASALTVCEADAPLLDSLDRYLALADSATDTRVLGPMLRREIHYRLLVAPSGAMLRHLIRHDSNASAIARAVAVLRRDFRSPMVVSELAREVGMSVSSFHKHFKDVTSSSPLQYQKDLRLLEARRMLVAGAASVTAVAFEVGYESPTQFSREYARRFGRPPSKDVNTGGTQSARGDA